MKFCLCFVVIFALLSQLTSAKHGQSRKHNYANSEKNLLAQIVQNDAADDIRSGDSGSDGDERGLSTSGMNDGHSGVVPVQVDLSSLMIQINNQISEIKDSIAKGQAAIEARVDSTESRLDTQMQQLRADINTKTQEVNNNLARRIGVLESNGQLKCISKDYNVISEEKYLEHVKYHASFDTTFQSVPAVAVGVTKAFEHELDHAHAPTYWVGVDNTDRSGFDFYLSLAAPSGTSTLEIRYMACGQA